MSEAPPSGRGHGHQEDEDDVLPSSSVFYVQPPEEEEEEDHDSTTIESDQGTSTRLDDSFAPGQEEHDHQLSNHTAKNVYGGTEQPPDTGVLDGSFASEDVQAFMQLETQLQQAIATQHETAHAPIDEYQQSRPQEEEEEEEEEEETNYEEAYFHDPPPVSSLVKNMFYQPPEETKQTPSTHMGKNRQQQKQPTVEEEEHELMEKDYHTHQDIHLHTAEQTEYMRQDDSTQDVDQQKIGPCPHCEEVRRTYEQEMRQMRRELTKYQNEIENCREEKEEFEKWRKKVKKETEQWAKEQREAAQRERRVASRQAKAELANAFSEKNKKESQQLSSLRATLEKTKLEYDATKKRLNAQIQTLKNGNQELKAQVAHLEDQIKAYEYERVELWGAPQDRDNNTSVRRKDSAQSGASYHEAGNFQNSHVSSQRKHRKQGEGSQPGMGKNNDRSFESDQSAQTQSLEDIHHGEEVADFINRKQYLAWDERVDANTSTHSEKEELAFHSDGFHNDSQDQDISLSSSQNNNEITASNVARGNAPDMDTISQTQNSNHPGNVAAADVDKSSENHFSTAAAATAPSTHPHGGGTSVSPVHSASQNETGFTATGSPVKDVNKAHSFIDPGDEIDTIRTLKDQRIETNFVSGARSVRYRNGTEKEVLPDGRELVRFFNGDVRKLYPKQGMEIYYFSQAGCVHTAYPNGTQVYEFNTGQVEHHHNDGRKEIKYPHGTTKLVLPNGDEHSYFQDGSVLYEYADGTKELISASDD